MYMDCVVEGHAPRIEVAIHRVEGTHHGRCCVCGTCRSPLQRIGKAARSHFFVARGCILPQGSRCCRKHIQASGNVQLLTPESMMRISISDRNAELTPSAVTELLSGVRDIALQRGLDFAASASMTDADYWRLLGVSKADFDNLLTYIEGHLRTPTTHSKRTALAVFLMKLRTGLSHDVLSTLFHLPKHVISRCMRRCRQVLMRNFVPRFLGCQNISRETVLTQHSRPLATQLFTSSDNNVVLVADGTYIYIEKSGDYLFQRRSFSLHKGRPLLKPMVVVTTTGYILDVFGPYFADGKNNDASIFRSLLATDSASLRSWLRPSDVLVVDRGFRDCLQFLEELEVIPRMPHFLQHGRQHTVDEENDSRLTTAVRWVIEAVNGLIKTWKLFKNVLPNSHIPFIGDYLRITCSLCNAYRPPRVSNPDDLVLANRMLQISRQPNLLQQRVESKKWATRRVIWETLSSSSITDFPQLTLDEIRQLTLGVYQIKQAKSYSRQHQDTHSGLYILSVHREEKDILRVQLQSRHTASKLYHLWLSYSNTQVTGWYCQCKSGARTVGCCAHIASVLWFLGYERHAPPTVSPVSYSTFITDAASSTSSLNI